MDFYYVNYFFEFLINGEWSNVLPRPDKIIVIASNIVEAKNKIDECINIYNNNKKDDERYRIIGDVAKISGICMFNNFNGEKSCCPICEK